MHAATTCSRRHLRMLALNVLLATVRQPSVDMWRVRYNTERTHSSLAYKALHQPAIFLMPIVECRVRNSGLAADSSHRRFFLCVARNERDLHTL